MNPLFKAALELKISAIERALSSLEVSIRQGWTSQAMEQLRELRKEFESAKAQLGKL